MSENFNMESRLVAVGSDVDWEQLYRRGETPWEKGAPHPALIQWLHENSLSGRVLVPGCGLGYDVRALAATGAEVLGLDIAPFAIAAARAFPRCGHESYLLGDFFEPGAVRGKFDWIFEHTCFCAIRPDRRDEYASRVAALIEPGSRFLAIFFLNPDHDEDGPPYGCLPDELEALFSPNFRVVSERDDLPTYPGREGRELLRLLVRR
jgi:SAM-dependent methyltransferase